MSKAPDRRQDDVFTRHEKQVEVYLPPKQFAIVRVDGRAFHTFTKQFERPFSVDFAGGMNAAALALCHEFTGTLFCYVQSDEISLVLTDRRNEASQYPFGGRTTKLASISAAIASVGFLRQLPQVKGAPVFDGRAFTLPSLELVDQYFNHRHADATKNAISMAAEAHFSPAQLHGKGTRERMTMLEELGEAQVPEDFFHGRVLVPTKVLEDVSYFDRKSQETVSVKAERTRWVSTPATREQRDAVIASLSDLA